MKRPTIALVCAISLTTFSASVHAGDPVAGQAKAAVCAGCHGMDGNSINGLWPKLAGQHEAYLMKSLKAFRSGERKEPTMNAMAKPLSDADIENLAAYFSAQKHK
jgi:cytochrome c553